MPLRGEHAVPVPVTLRLNRLANTSGDPTGADGTEFLADLDEADWSKILRYCAHRGFRAGETIVRQGDLDRSLLFLTAGAVEVVVEKPGGGRRVQARVEAPAVVGEVAFFDDGPRSASVVALRPSEALELGFASFETMAATMPALSRRLLLEAGRVLARRLRRTTAETTR